MSKAESILSFVDAIKESGISISDEKLLVSRLTAACEGGADLSIALTKVAINSKASGVSFYADARHDGNELVKTFKKYQLDGYAFRDFILSLKPLA